MTGRPRRRRSLKVLFCCTGNRMRSITAAHLLKKRGGHEVRSAGTHAAEIWGGGTQLTQDHLEWADRIVVFEHMHVEYIRSRFGPTLGRKARCELVNLNVPDMFPAFDPKLIEILNAHLDRLFRATGSRSNTADPFHT